MSFFSISLLLLFLSSEATSWSIAIEDITIVTDKENKQQITKYSKIEIGSIVVIAILEKEPKNM